MLTLEQLREWRALAAGPANAAPDKPILAERRTLLAVLDEVIAGREGWPIETAPGYDELRGRCVILDNPAWPESQVARREIDGGWLIQNSPAHRFGVRATRWMHLPRAAEQEPTDAR